MALGCVFQISWICFLLFDGSLGLPALKGYGYPSVYDTRNTESEALISTGFENRQPSNNQAPIYEAYNKPAVERAPVDVPSQPNVPNAPTGSAVDRLVNAVVNLNKPLVFPLGSNLAKPQSPSYPVAASNSMPASASSTGVSSASAAAPSTPSRQPEPAGVGYSVVEYNPSRSVAGSSLPRLVYEDVFQYPSENVQIQNHGAASNAAGSHGQASTGPSTYSRYPTNVGAQPAFPPWVGHFRRPMNPYSESENQPRREISRLPQQPVNTQAEAPQRVSEPIFPPPPPPSYIIQSRNDYQRARYSDSYHMYDPEWAAMAPSGPKGVKAPAPQPAAGKGAASSYRG